MKLYYTPQDKEFAIEIKTTWYKRRTPQLKGAIVDLINQYESPATNTKAFGVLKKLIDLGIKADDKEAAMKAFADGHITLNDLKATIDVELIKRNDNITIDIFKSLIDYDKIDQVAKLTTAQKEDFIESMKSVADSEFWLSQDLIEIENEVKEIRNTFRV